MVGTGAPGLRPASPRGHSVIDGLSDGLDARAHEDDHVLGVGDAVLEQPVVASGQGGESIIAPWTIDGTIA